MSKFNIGNSVENLKRNKIPKDIQIQKISLFSKIEKKEEKNT